MALFVAAAPALAGSCFWCISCVLHIQHGEKGTNLVLGQCGDLGVDRGDAGAEDTGETDAACVALEGSVYEGCHHAVDAAGGFCIGECLVCSGLLEAVGIRDLTSTFYGRLYMHD